MRKVLRNLMQSLAWRLLVPLLATVSAVLIANAVVSQRATEQQWTELTVNGARRTSELVKRATHYGMLLNRKEEVHHTINQLAKGQGVADIRVYDKRGNIIFSTRSEEVGRRVDVQAEACVSCHADGLRAPAAGGRHSGERTRTFRGPDGQRVLALISPFRNSPECSNAACHAHPPDQTILGVLDVQMSLAGMDEALRINRERTAWVTLLMVLIVAAGTSTFIYSVVRRPVARLYEGTRRVAAGDLKTRIEIPTHDELGRLGAAFNRMTADLRAAREELLEKNQELERAQRQVLQMEKMASLGKLAATVAHELNNPLAGILTYAKLVDRTLADMDVPEGEREEVQRYLGLVQRESVRCGGIVRNMLLFARQSGLNLRETSLNERVRHVLMLVRHQMELAGVSCEVELLPGDDVVVCDAEQIEQALVALVVNAIEIMEPAGGGRLTIALSERPAGGERGEEDVVRVEVRDTGGGIPEEVLEHIFEPFFSTKNKAAGVGLGLAVVYGIVQRHGYTIEVHSELGKGTVFQIDMTRRPRRQDGRPRAA